MVASTAFAEFMCEQLAPLGQFTMRRMFGKTGTGSPPSGDRPARLRENLTQSR